MERGLKADRRVHARALGERLPTDGPIADLMPVYDDDLHVVSTLSGAASVARRERDECSFR